MLLDAAEDKCRLAKLAVLNLIEHVRCHSFELGQSGPCNRSGSAALETGFLPFEDPVGPSTQR
jgi:hypothetical protein